MIESEASNNPILYPEGIRRAKGEDQKPPHQPLPLVDTIPESLREEDGLVMTSWIRAWYHRYQEYKKILRGHLETRFNDLLDIKEVIDKEIKDGEDYVGTT